MRIGLTQRVLYHKGRGYDSLDHGWYLFLKDHTLTFIPNRLDQDFANLVDNIDCLIITGGDDSALRRSTELKIAGLMMMQFKPIIGVCHGAFLITDVLGGIVSPCEDHMDTEHNINYFDQKILVNSYHTQYITKLHSTGNILATDDQGNCEAFIDRNLAGIVWHPERSVEPWMPEEIANLIR